jgi:pimeloyl-ACP methyl ester carboxylesterase
MTEPPAHHFQGRDGTELAYREVGEGRPLVLLNGFTGTARQLIESGLPGSIAKHGFRVIVPDFRGHGDSARPHDPAAYPPDVLAQDGLALVESLGLEPGGWDLAGYSLGGRVVLRMLARGAVPGRAVIGGQGLDATSSETSRTGGYRELLTAMIGGTTEPGSPQARFAQYLTETGGDPRALLHVAGTHVETTAGELAAIAVPTLVVTGDQDTARKGDALAAVLPNGHFAEVPGDHGSTLDSPQLVAAIVAFLTG